MEREELNTPKMLRRVRLDLNTPAELAIFKAMQEVEKAGADVRLTEATMLLAKAKDCVADFIDGVEQSIPPAEGAEQLTKEQFTAIIEDSVKDIWYGRRSINPVKEQTELLVEKLYPLMNKPQPTAEGADEIHVKHGFFIMAHKDSNEEVRKAFIEPVLAAMQEFATLHAHKIADKMVSDRLREELGLYNDWLNGAAGKYLTNPFIDEYLKSEYYLKSREEKK